LPISQLQPTPQEEVENAIQEDNAETTTSSANDTPIADTANATEATDDATTTATQPESVRRRVDRTPSPRDAASNLTEGIDTMDVRKPFREPPTPKESVYVGNLFFDVTENDLTKEFQQFGTIKNARLIRDARGLSKGFVQKMTCRFNSS